MIAWTPSAKLFSVTRPCLSVRAAESLGDISHWQPIISSLFYLPAAATQCTQLTHETASLWRSLKRQMPGQGTKPHRLLFCRNHMNLDICSQRFRIDDRSFSCTKREFPATTGIPIDRVSLHWCSFFHRRSGGRGYCWGWSTSGYVFYLFY